MEVKNLNTLKETFVKGAGAMVDKIVDIYTFFVDVKLSKHDKIVITEVVIYV